MVKKIEIFGERNKVVILDDSKARRVKCTSATIPFAAEVTIPDVGPGLRIVGVTIKESPMHYSWAFGIAPLYVGASLPTWQMFYQDGPIITGVDTPLFTMLVPDEAAVTVLTDMEGELQ